MIEKFFNFCYYQNFAFHGIAESDTTEQLNNNKDRKSWAVENCSPFTTSPLTLFWSIDSEVGSAVRKLSSSQMGETSFTHNLCVLTLFQDSFQSWGPSPKEKVQVANEWGFMAPFVPESSQSERNQPLQKYIMQNARQDEAKAGIKNQDC